MNIIAIILIIITAIVSWCMGVLYIMRRFERVTGMKLIDAVEKYKKIGA